MAAAFAGIKQLSVDADARDGPPRAALQDVAHAEFPGDLAYIYGLVLERKAGVARNKKEAGRFREFGDDVLGQTIGEEFLLRVGAEAREREHVNRGLSGQRKPNRTGRLLAEGGDAIDPDGLGNVLHLARTDVLKRDRQFVLDLIVHGSRNAYRARLGQRLKPYADNNTVSPLAGRLTGQQYHARPWEDRFFEASVATK
jgi:hypothetical protein